MDIHRKHGVVVSMDSCMAWDDSCCQLRIARPGQPQAQAQANAAAQSGSSSDEKSI